jgi:TPR repeat protein
VTLDSAVALGWFRKAAEQNFPPAMARIGSIYVRGEGVVADPVEAYKWLLLAAVQKDPDASRDIADLAVHMTPAQIDQAKQAATAWVGRHSPQH